MKKTEESKALREVWEWKDQAYREVAHLDLASALRKRLEDSMRNARNLKNVASRSEE